MAGHFDILYDSNQLDWSWWSGLPDWLKALDVDAHAFDVAAGAYDPETSDAASGIILLDATEYFLANRLKLSGRAWVCLCSWCYDSIYPIGKSLLPVTELGVHAVVSNCKVFIEQVSTMVPPMFCWHPYEPALWQAKPTANTIIPAIGAVLPNVADRDFCLLERARSVLASLGAENRLLVALQREKDLDSLPGSLKRVAASGQPVMAFQELLAVVPAPRLTDYRTGVVPPELCLATALGIPVVGIQHPAIEPLSKYQGTLCRSLTAFDELIAALADGKPVPMSKPVPAGALVSDMAAFARQVVTMYEGWRHAREA